MHGDLICPGESSASTRPIRPPSFPSTKGKKISIRPAALPGLVFALRRQPPQLPGPNSKISPTGSPARDTAHPGVLRNLECWQTGSPGVPYWIQSGVATGNPSPNTLLRSAAGAGRGGHREPVSRAQSQAHRQAVRRGGRKAAYRQTQTGTRSAS
jgi:hypothetical protein